MLWGVPVTATNAINQDTFMVGDFTWPPLDHLLLKAMENGFARSSPSSRPSEV